MPHYIAINHYGADVVNTWEVRECSHKAQQALLAEDKPYIRKATTAEIAAYKRSGEFAPYYLPEELED